METIYVGEGVYRAAKDTMYYEVYSEEQMKKMAQRQGGFSGIKVIGKKNAVSKRLEFENFNHPAITDKQRDIITWAKDQTEAPLVITPEQRLNMGLRGTTIYDMSKNAVLNKTDELPKKIGGGHNDWERETDDGSSELNEDFMEEDNESNGHGKDDTGGSAADGDAPVGDKP